MQKHTSSNSFTPWQPWHHLALFAKKQTSVQEVNEDVSKRHQSFGTQASKYAVPKKWQMCPSLGCFQSGFVPESSSHCDMQCHEECAIFAAVPLSSRTHLVEKLSFDCRLSKSHHYCSTSVSYEKAFDKDESLVITQMVVLILRKSSCWPFSQSLIFIK